MIRLPDPISFVALLTQPVSGSFYSQNPVADMVYVISGRATGLYWSYFQQLIMIIRSFPPWTWAMRVFVWFTVRGRN